MNVYKYQFDIDDCITIRIPAGARVLHVDEQQGKPCVWALVDPSNELKPYRFRIYGTGHEIEAGAVGAHVGTFQQLGGILVWHVFEDSEATPIASLNPGGKA